MSVSQRAMGLALPYPEPDKGGARKKGVKSEAVSVAEAAGISPARLAEARTIFRLVPEPAKLVLDGTLSLDEGMTEARRPDKATKDMERLRKEGPCRIFQQPSAGQFGPGERQRTGWCLGPGAPTADDSSRGA
jgi:hypothetical protein